MQSLKPALVRSLGLDLFIFRQIFKNQSRDPVPLQGEKEECPDWKMLKEDDQHVGCLLREYG